MKTNLFLLCTLTFTLTACQKAAPSQMPHDWVVNSPKEEASDSDIDPTQNPKLGESVEHIYEAQAASFSEAEEMSAFPVSADKNGDEPWHLTAMITDLSISVNGVLGALIYKGTPAITAIWEKQYAKPGSPPQTASDTAEAIAISSELTDTELAQALEPSMQAAMATGHVHDERRMREESLKAAFGFQAMASALESMDPNLPWSVGRFRLDLVIDATGTVTPVISVTPEMRLRFEWHRLKRPSAKSLAYSPAANGIGLKLVQFAKGIAQDLIELSDDSVMEASGFKAYTYRVGVGINNQQNIGVLSSNQSATGHLYFSRNVPSPVVNPKPGRAASIDASPAVNLMGEDGALTPVTHKRFRKGLNRALKLGAFFAHHANRHPAGKWKVHELRAGFDISLGGKTGLAGLSGIGSTEIDFFNEKF